MLHIRKFVLPTILATALSVSAATQIKSGVAALNKAVEELLLPFNTEKTLAKMIFSKIETNEVRATDLSMTTHYKKIGTYNVLDLNLSKLKYHYDKTNPTVKLNASLAFDLTKYLTPTELDSYVEGAQEILESLVSETLKEYGTAARVKLDILNKTKNKDGHYTSLKAQAVIKINISELPKNVQVNEVFAKEASILISVIANKSTSAKISVVMNPKYKGFDPDQTGLKETLDALKNADAKTLSDLQTTIAFIDYVATTMVETEAKK